MTFARRDQDVGVVAPRSAPPSPRRRHTTLARLVGAVGLITLTALLFWLLTDDAFRVSDERVSFRGLAHADEAEVRAYLTDIDRGPNVFRMRASDIVSQLSNLTEVDAAYARVTLPADVSVTLDERDPVFIWSEGERAWLVDEEGMLFAPAKVEVKDSADGDPGVEEVADEQDTGSAVRAELPIVEDGRVTLAEQPTVGSHLPGADLAVMRQLLAVTPELLGSLAQDLHLRIDERDGYVLGSVDQGWLAIFGHYSPTIQPPEDIPRQVQCLRWLLASQERQLEQIRLALSENACGTFTRFNEKRAKGS